MADFRKWILALTVLALFAGLASAQSNLITCSPGTTGIPQLRGEGLTEEVGDIIIQCAGGTFLPAGSVIPTANFVVYLNGTVTSRLLGSSNSLPQASEAVLMIDEPQTPAVQVACTSSSAGAGINGCTEYVSTATYAPVTGVGGVGGTQGANMFQGVVSGGAVTFYGVPVLPPVSSGAVRIFRITNIRVNANGLSGGGTLPGTAQADVAIGSLTNPNTGLNTNYTVSVSNPQLTVGFVSQSLSTSVYNPYSHSTTYFSSITGLAQCATYTSNGRTSGDPVALETLRFSELQGSAFKTRGLTTQTIPGNNTFNTESGFTFAGYTGSVTGSEAGYADWGTRLKAVFTNIPSGVNLYVGTSNLNSSDNAQLSAPFAPTSSFAELVTSEAQTYFGSSLPLLAATGTSTADVTVSGGGTASGPFSGTATFAQLPIVNGSATAVWEVVNSLANTAENFDFEVYLYSYPNVTSNTPTPGTMSVNLSYAPVPDATDNMTLAAASVASYNYGVPRFADTSKAATTATVSICQTALLFPYVTETAGFDTGLAIANTSADPFGTPAQTGACSVYWYGTTPPTTNPGYVGSAGYQTTAPTTAQYMAAGTIQAWATSVAAPGFNGYVIAVCNFQMAHGFAFVSDLGARNLAMGYLADVLSVPINGGTPRFVATGGEGNGQ